MLFSGQVARAALRALGCGREGHDTRLTFGPCHEPCPRAQLALELVEILNRQSRTNLGRSAERAECRTRHRTLHATSIFFALAPECKYKYSHRETARPSPDLRPRFPRSKEAQMTATTTPSPGSSSSTRTPARRRRPCASCVRIPGTRWTSVRIPNRRRHASSRGCSSSITCDGTTLTTVSIGRRARRASSCRSRGSCTRRPRRPSRSRRSAASGARRPCCDTRRRPQGRSTAAGIAGASR